MLKRASLLILLWCLNITTQAQIKTNAPNGNEIGRYVVLNPEQNVLYSVNSSKGLLTKWDLWTVLPLKTVAFPKELISDYYSNLMNALHEKDDSLFVELNDRLLAFSKKDLSHSPSALPKDYLKNKQKSYTFDHSQNASAPWLSGFHDKTGNSVEEDYIPICNNNSYVMIRSGAYIVYENAYYDRATFIKVDNRKDPKEYIFDYSIMAGALSADNSTLALLEEDFSTIHLYHLTCDDLEEYGQVSVPKLKENFKLKFLDNTGSRLVIGSLRSLDLIKTSELEVRTIQVNQDTLINPLEGSDNIVNPSKYPNFSVNAINKRFFNWSAYGRAEIVDFVKGETILAGRSLSPFKSPVEEVLMIPYGNGIQFFDVNLKKVVRKIENKHIPKPTNLEMLTPHNGHFVENTINSFNLFPIPKWQANTSTNWFGTGGTLCPIQTRKSNAPYVYKNAIIDWGRSAYYFSLFGEQKQLLAHMSEIDGDSFESGRRDTIAKIFNQNIDYAGGAYGMSEDGYYFAISNNYDWGTKRDSLVMQPILEKDLNQPWTNQYLGETNTYDIRPYNNDFAIYLSDTLFIRNLEGVYSHAIPSDSIVGMPHFTSHGDSLLWMTEDTLCLLDLSNDKLSKYANSLTNDTIFNPIYSPNGRWIILDGLNKDIRIELNTSGAKFERIQLGRNLWYAQSSRPKDYNYSANYYHLGNTGQPYHFDGSFYNGFNDSAVIQSYKINDEGFEWLMMTPDGYYSGTPQAVKALSFSDGAQVFPFSQYDHIYNRPDIISHRISQLLGAENTEGIEHLKRLYEKRLKKMGIKEKSLQSNSRPDYLIIDKQNLASHTEDSLRFDVSIKSNGTPLSELVVEINDVPNFRLDLSAENGQDIQQAITINTAQGFNMIRSYVVDVNGNKSLPEYNIVYNTQKTSKPNLYLVSIGAGKYVEEDYNLKYASKDAYDIALSFKKDSAFNTVFTKTIVNELVTKSALEDIKNFLKDAKINDEVVIFIAGHGVLDENLDYYLATYNMNFNNPSEKGIAYDQLESVLSEINPLKKLLIMDACHSGEIDTDEVLAINQKVSTSDDIVFRAVGTSLTKKSNSQFGNSTDLMKQLFSDTRTGNGATVISSAGGAEFAIESDQWQNGLFTYCMIKGLKEKAADLNKDGEILISELQEYVQSQVYKLSNGRQKPTSRIENISMDFVIWK